MSYRIPRGVRRVAFLLGLLAVSSAPAVAAGSVNVYSYRQPQLIQPMLDAFTKKTGIEVKVLHASKGLEEKIAAEGANSPADLLFTVDIGRLSAAKNKGITAPFHDKFIEENVPAQYRDPDGHWIGLTTRSRVVLASKERVKQDSISYEELADPKWKGKICIRSGQNDYNVALIASMIAHHGEAKTEEWLKGVKENLARKPAGNDRVQAKGVYTGECDLAITNTYYMALMMTNEKEPEQKKWAESVKLIFPNQGDRGAHMNISGMSLIKTAPNKENAIKLMEFLASAEGQALYAQANNEFPVKEGVQSGPIAASWGKFKADDVSIAKIGELRKKASELVDKVGFDAGPST
ncbi:MAG: Fe(3+) ABC transporter substrate-binding protein [Hyphomicrobiales bacterium]